MTDTPSLWPKLDHIETSENPRSFLKVQAALLGGLTGNKLLAEVKVVPKKENDGLITYFNLFVPAAKNYKYELFYFVTEGILFFPMKWYFDNSGTQISNLESFKREVEVVLKSPKTREVLRGLLALADEA